jgi:hypothetical protein
VTDEYAIFQGHALANESMAGNLAALADFHAFLNFHERPNFHIVSDFTPVKIGEIKDADAFAKFYAGGDFLKRLRW